MWVHTLDGFYSVTERTDCPPLTDRKDLQVRARVPADLHRLRTRLAGLGVAKRHYSEVIDTPQGDYAHRVMLTRSAWGRYLAGAVECIDYRNFKDAVHDVMGPERAHPLMDVWHAMGTLQAGGPYGAGLRFHAIDGEPILDIDGEPLLDWPDEDDYYRPDDVAEARAMLDLEDAFHAPSYPPKGLHLGKPSRKRRRRGR